MRPSACCIAAGITDRRDHERWRVDPSVQEQRVADAAYRAGGEHPDVHDRHCLGPAGPERVDDGLHIALVNDQIVGSDPVRPVARPLAVRRRAGR